MSMSAENPESESTGEPAAFFERRPWGRGDLIALAVWTLAIAAFFWDVVGLRRALFYFDITEINYPYRHFFAEELKAGRFSRWCPGLYCGLPLFSESQAGYLHPFKYLLYPWLATWQAFNLDTVLSVWLTGVGTYLWLRRHVGPAGALTGAAVLGLSGFTWGHLIHTSMINALASLPFVIWGLEASWSSGRWRGAILGGLALACQVFAGHLQDALFTVVLVGIYGLYRAATERGTKAANPHPEHGRDPGPRGRPGLGRAVGPLDGAARTIAAGRGPEMEGAHLRLVASRAAADPGRPRGLRHPRPRHRLAGRLLPVSRDEHLHGPDRHGAGGRRRRGAGAARSLGELLGDSDRTGRDPDAGELHDPVRPGQPDPGAGQLARAGAVPPLGGSGCGRPGGRRRPAAVAPGRRLAPRCLDPRGRARRALHPDHGVSLHPGLDLAE